MNTKRCNRCGEYKPVNQFGVRTDASDGLQRECRQCRNAEQRERHRTQGGKPIPPLTERFWARVEKTDTCWLWIGAINDDGFGKIQHRKRQLMVHRLAYRWEIGEIPAGYDVVHRGKQNRVCVRPDHLTLISHVEVALRNLPPHRFVRRPASGAMMP